MNCPDCGAEIEDTMAKCKNCGFSEESPLAHGAFIAGLIGLLFLLAIIIQSNILGPLLSLKYLGLLILISPWVLSLVLGLVAWKRLKARNGKLPGYIKAHFGIWVGVAGLALTALCAYSGALLQMPEYSIRSKVSRARSDMRALAMAIEEYYVDHNMYPAAGMGDRGPQGMVSWNYRLAKERGQNSQLNSPLPFWNSNDLRTGVRNPIELPTFLMGGATSGSAIITLTTPHPYLTTYPADAFSPLSSVGSVFLYWSIYPGHKDLFGHTYGKDSPIGGVGWILVSAGPDRDYDLADEYSVYNPAVAQPSARLLAGTNRRGSAFTYDPTNGVISDGDVWRIKQ